MKFIDFLLFLWVIFALLDPDPHHCWPQWLSFFRIHHQVSACIRSASDPLYLEGEPRDELIRKRNQVLRPHRCLRQSGIHQEDLDARLGLLLLPDVGDTTALPAVVDAHSDQRPNLAAPRGSVVVIVFRIQIFPVRNPVPGIFINKLRITFFQIHVKTFRIVCSKLLFMLRSK
jgi:hypothetical protein